MAPCPLESRHYIPPLTSCRESPAACFVVRTCPTVWSLRKHRHPRLSFCSTELRDGVKWDINPGLNVSLFSSSIVYKWRLGAILSERIVCAKTKAHLNARWPSFESATALTVKHWTVDLMMFVTLLVNYSGLPYCVYESREWANIPQSVCVCIYIYLYACACTVL